MLCSTLLSLLTSLSWVPHYQNTCPTPGFPSFSIGRHTPSVCSRKMGTQNTWNTENSEGWFLEDWDHWQNDGWMDDYRRHEKKGTWNFTQLAVVKYCRSKEVLLGSLAGKTGRSEDEPKQNKVKTTSCQRTPHKDNNHHLFHSLFREPSICYFSFYSNPHNPLFLH